MSALTTRQPKGDFVVSADRDRLVQVLINLLSNAAKFAPADVGRVEVELAAAGGALRVTVADNGPGVRVEDQRVIFEKFRQAGDVMTDRPQGTGLGLPISRQIIEHFGGRLWVESVPGEGAKFVFELPLGAARGRARRRCRRKEKRMSKKVLIADDEPNIVVSLEFLMKQKGYEVRTVSNGEDALRAVGEFGPDLILLDVMMPRMSGYDVCQKVRENPAWQGIRIIMLSAKGRDVEVTRAWRSARTPM